MGAGGVVDLEVPVTDFMWSLFHQSASRKEKRLFRNKHLKLRIDWHKAHFTYKEPKDIHAVEAPKPKAQVVFSTTFDNVTGEDHSYSMKTERTTKSTCSIEVTNAVTTGTEVELSLKTPMEVFEANVGFSKEECVTNAQGETIEHDLHWSVDSAVNSPARTTTEAKVYIEQKAYNRSFEVETIITGKVLAFVINTKDNNKQLRGFEHTVAELFKDLPGFTRRGNSVSYVAKGKCDFSFGVRQYVQLLQKPLPSDFDAEKRLKEVTQGEETTAPDGEA